MSIFGINLQHWNANNFERLYKEGSPQWGMLQISWPPAFCGKPWLPVPCLLGLAFILCNVQLGFLLSCPKPCWLERGRSVAFVWKGLTVCCESSVMVGKQSRNWDTGFWSYFCLSLAWVTQGKFLSCSEPRFSHCKTGPFSVLSKRTFCDDGNILCLHGPI